MRLASFEVALVAGDSPNLSCTRSLRPRGERQTGKGLKRTELARTAIAEGKDAEQVCPCQNKLTSPLPAQKLRRNSKTQARASVDRPQGICGDVPCYLLHS